MALSYLRDRTLLFHLVASAEAYIKFEPTCSIPTTHVNFVSSPNSRGTLDILWSSLFMIIACTWTVQHLNIPEQRNGRDPGQVGDLKWKLKGFLQSAKWMMIMMIAPEFIVGMAYYDLLWAKESHQKLREFASQDHLPWTLTHTYYANMGGFVIQSGVQEDVHVIPYIPAENVNTGNCPEKANVSGTQVLEVINNDKVVQKSHPTTISKNDGSYPYHNPYHLTAIQICELRREGFLPKLPYISKEELDDKSKGNSFIKAIALFQIIWATIQIIVRAVRNIAISQLELAVIAFATCAVIIYLLYWSKPKSVSTVTTILQYQDQIPKDVLQRIEICTAGTSQFGTFLFTAKGGLKPRHGSWIENDALEFPGGDYSIALATWAMAFGATLFGGIHIGAWNFEFPSRIELILWRCASVISASFGPTILLLIYLKSFYPKVSNGNILTPISTFLYIMARLFLLVEIFRTLCFLPPDAYVSTWTTNIPHVI